MQQVAYAEFRLIFVLRERKPDGRKRHPIFLGLFYKSANLFLLWMHTNKSKPFTIPIIFKGVFASTVRREKSAFFFFLSLSL